MDLILNNPYRHLGLLVGASAKEQKKQETRLKMYLDAEQEPDLDFSLPVLGELSRTADSVTDSAAKLTLDKDKINAALFWFCNVNKITDEPAFDALKDNDLDAAIAIWTKLTASADVTARNFSAYHNLSTLLLCKGYNSKTLNTEYFNKSILLKINFLESDYIKEFLAVAVDTTYKTTKKELQLAYLNSLLTVIEQTQEFGLNHFVQAINSQSFEAKDEFWKGYIRKPITTIQTIIDTTKTKRKADKSKADKLAATLFKECNPKLNELKAIFGISNLQVSSISDKLSEELLQCGIDYFKHYKETSTDPGNTVMQILKKAKELAIGQIVKQRCDENIENLKEWIDDKPEREKQTRIIADFEKLKQLIDEFEGRSETIENGKQLVAKAKPFLNNVKNTLGANDELYLGLSSRIASDAMGMSVTEINSLQDRFANSYDSASKLASIRLLKERVNSAWELLTTIGAMDLQQEFRTRFTQNKISLSSLKTQLAAVNVGSNSSSGRGSSGTSGCYIATMAFGDYDHPQVIVLRQYRDEVLEKSSFGKWFIKTYYHYSPMLVKRLKNKKSINIIIRKILNQFIKLIK